MIGQSGQCKKTMDLVLDGMDGERDGQSHIVDDLVRTYPLLSAFVYTSTSQPCCFAT
jgi:hypothetical protein